MRNIILIGFLLIILGVLNFSIYQKEQLKSEAESVLLELAPVDPRSLMQGDYMRLRYQIERDIPKELVKDQEKRGYMVIDIDDMGVAKFLRFNDEGSLESNQKLLRYHKKYNTVRIVPDSFMFQEGHAELYEEAKYGVFKFDDNGKHMLVGLADADRKLIRSGNNNVM